MNLTSALDWLYSTQLFGMKLGLDNPRELLKKYLAYPPMHTKVVHVAGTNGKGSTCAFMDSLSRACGLRTGLFTSPHLIRYHERMKISGQEISDDELLHHLTEIKKICETMEHHPTFFEITLAIAMKHFTNHECEIIILETGMGGKLDATSAVPADVAVITPIGLDHTQWLGDTIEKIATEKAGIIRERKPVISSAQVPAAEHVIRMAANELQAPLSFVMQPLEGYPISLRGNHQKSNAAVAVAALHAAGLALRYDTLSYALSHTIWPGRYEEIMHEGKKFILDGAHNPHAAKVLSELLTEEFSNKKVPVIFSAVASKDIAGVLTHIAPHASHFYLCPVESSRAVSTEEVAAALPIGTSYSEHECAEDAISAAWNHGNEPILICGSLYLVGKARSIFLHEKFQVSEQ